MFEKQFSVKKEYDALAVGEVLLRLSPQNKERILNCEIFEKKAGGSELNVVSGISQLGLRSGIITKIPNNEIGKFIKNKIRFSDVSDDYIIYDNDKKSRLGLYYYEYGAMPRKPIVVYDRANSSINTLKTSELNKDIFTKTKLFHISGITLALNEQLRKESREMIKLFKENNTLISFDVNFRATLWDNETARKEIEKILPLIDILFISEESARKMFKKEGKLKDIMKSFSNEFGCSIIASTQRKVHSATKHTWNSTIYTKENSSYYQDEPYFDIEVVDRIGSGDAYVSGVLFGILKYNDIQKAIEFGDAMAAVKNTISGDMPVSDFDEISRVIKEHKEKDGSEMIR
ncbi:MAG: sugar kinase [Spirochaetes bacterium]|nr:sugar kinase [Spirochaetota bacterium]